MIFKIPINTLPRLEEIYEIERKTLWHSADRRSILLFIVNGACVIELGAEKFILNEGDVFFIPPRTEYQRKPLKDTPCKFIYLHFTTEGEPISVSFEEAKKALLDDAVKSTALQDTKKLSNLPPHLYLMQKTTEKERLSEVYGFLCGIIEIYQTNPNNAPLLTALRLTEFLSTLSLIPSSEVFANTTDSKLPNLLRNALSLVQQSYDKKLSTEELAAYCHISPQHLIRLFKNHLGVTPLQYITKNKMSSAIEMLRQSELSIKEIAYALGYDTPSYFTRLFTKEIGSSPSEIRTRIHEYKAKDENGALPQKY